MIVEILEDSDGEMILPFPDELIESLGWEIGDTLNFEQLVDGTFKISKVNENRDPQ